jgi:hypothetical protein
MLRSNLVITQIFSFAHQQFDDIELWLFTPKGLQKVARDWSAAEIPGTIAKKIAS